MKQPSHEQLTAPHGGSREAGVDDDLHQESSRYVAEAFELGAFDWAQDLEVDTPL